jgi:hypothetical protein
MPNAKSNVKREIKGIQSNVVVRVEKKAEKARR